MNRALKGILALLALAAGLILLLMSGLITSWLFWILLGGIFVLIFLWQKQYRQNLLIISILGFLAGLRGIDFSPSFIIYPTELFIWMGFFICLLDQIINRKSKTHQPKPSSWEILLVAFAVLGGVVALYYHRELLDILFPLKTFLVFVPMLVVFRSWIQDKHQITLYAKILIYVGCVISILGLVERYVPGVAALFSKYMPTPIETRYNFEFNSTIELAAFSSWGTPVVATLLVLFAGLALFIPAPNVGWQKKAWFLAFPILASAIIATGYRSAWLGLILIFMLGVIFNRKQTMQLFLMLIPGIFILFSSAFIDRFKTIFTIINSRDTSFVIRSLALQNGLHTIQNSFLLMGTGWDSPTAFNDWINLGIAMGAFGLLVFAIWYGLVLVRLFKYARKTKDLLYIAFFAALSGYSIAMISGAMSQVFPIMTGFWFVFCLAWRLTEISEQEELMNGKVVGVVTNL